MSLCSGVGKHLLRKGRCRKVCLTATDRLVLARRRGAATVIMGHGHGAKMGMNVHSQVLMADVADPLCPPDVVLPAGLADLGPAHLAEGASVHDAPQLGPAAGARPARVGRPHHGAVTRGPVDCAGVGVRLGGGQDADGGAAPLQLLELRAESAEKETGKRRLDHSRSDIHLGNQQGTGIASTSLIKLQMKLSFHHYFLLS